METKNKLVDAIVKGIQEKKGQDITIADLRALDGSIANYFVICQGNSPSQGEAIADSVSQTARIATGLLGGYGLWRRACACVHTRGTRLLQSRKSVAGRCHHRGSQH